LYSQLGSIAGQQQLSSNAPVVSGAAVRLVLELQLLASGAVQRQLEQHRQQQQQALTPEDRAIMDEFALECWHLLGLQIKALVATSRSCLLPELLHQAGLQLLQALVAPLQQWHLSSVGDSALQSSAVASASPDFGETLQALVTAACGAQPTVVTHSEAPIGEHQCFSGVLPATATAAANVQSTWHSDPQM
jgi:hypothetical protein